MKTRQSQCSTCIYREDSPLDLAALESEIRDKRMPEHFSGWRACHTDRSNETICEGFRARHGENCTPIQIASRLGLIKR